MRRPRAHAAPPSAAILLALAGLVVFFVLPVVALAVRAPWGRIGAELSAPTVREALRLSAVTSLSATALCIAFGLPMAWVLARARFPGRAVLRAVAMAPLVLPPVAGGVALLLAFGRNGVVGRWLDEVLGIRLAFTTTGAIFAATFVALPFLILSVEGALRSLDPRYEEAAATLGAGSRTTFFRVALPMIGPSLATGAALCWARALGEFGATIAFAGSSPGRTQTLPLTVYLTLQTDPDAAIVLSLLLLAVSIAVLAVLGSRLVVRRAQ